MAIYQAKKRTVKTKNGRVFYRILKSSQARQVDLFGFGPDLNIKKQAVLK